MIGGAGGQHGVDFPLLVPDLGQYFHHTVRITTINQEVISSNDEIEPYFERWFGEGGYLKTLRMELEADALTEFYADKTFGVVRGSGKEDYVLSDKRFFPMETRWTATVSKDSDGQWRILTLHIGTNFLDNPILSMAENSAKYFADQPTTHSPEGSVRVRRAGRRCIRRRGWRPIGVKLRRTRTNSIQYFNRISSFFTFAF